MISTSLDPRTGPAERDADPVALAAVDAARAALVEEVGADFVGDHLGVVAEDGVVTHSFASTQPGYRGWTWAVIVAHAPEQDGVTVDEVVLLPGSEAIIAPAVDPLPDADTGEDLSDGGEAD